MATEVMQPLVPPSANEDPNIKTLIIWFLAVICLALVSVTTGTPNLYPAKRDDIKAALGLSDSMTTFMLTGGVLLLYVSFPAGVFMDRFGPTLTLFLSILLILPTYLALPYTFKIPGLFITLYLIMAFGSASTFVSCMQLALGRAPVVIKGVSMSIVSASLSLSLAAFLEIFKAGDGQCRIKPCAIAGVQVVSFVVCPVLIVMSPLAWFLYKRYPQGGNKPGTGNWSLLLSSEIYILIVAMLLTVYDGMMVVSAGSRVWQEYGVGYPNGAAKWGTWFSVTNCIFSIVLSSFLDLIITKCGSTRARVFAFFWFVLGAVPLIVAILFRKTDNYNLFGVFMSAMGIPFGLGLTQIPALVSDTFGNDRYGFAFGIVQIGAIIASASTMPIVQPLAKNGIMVCFIVAAVAHVVIAALVLIFLKQNSLTHISITDVD
jgi:MFS family permease